MIECPLLKNPSPVRAAGRLTTSPYAPWVRITPMFNLSVSSARLWSEAQPAISGQLIHIRSADVDLSHLQFSYVLCYLIYFGAIYSCSLCKLLCRRTFTPTPQFHGILTISGFIIVTASVLWVGPAAAAAAVPALPTSCFPQRHTKEQGDPGYRAKYKWL